MTELLIARAQLGPNLNLQNAARLSCWFSSWRRRWGW